MAQAPQRLLYIDVLRAVAILSVLFCHLPPELPGAFGRIQMFGGRGVDLFFVLSGFLIGTTALVRAEQPIALRHKFKIFWMLRVARIWPLYFGLLAAYVLLPQLFPGTMRTTLLGHPFPYLTFTSNYFYQDALELGVLWSLAIEEQFYLVVGILIGVASMRRQTLATAFFAVSLVVTAVSMRYRVEILDLLDNHGLDRNIYIGKLYHGTLGRMDQLGLGLLAAVVAPSVSARVRLTSPLFAWAAIATTVLAILYVPQWPVLGHFALGMVFVLCVLVVQLPTLRLPASRVGRAPLRAIADVGKVSFGLYLFHPFVRRWLFPSFQRHAWSSQVLEAGLFLLTWFAAAMILAELSYRFFESPLLRWVRARGASATAAKPEALRSATG